MAQSEPRGKDRQRDGHDHGDAGSEESGGNPEWIKTGRGRGEQSQQQMVRASVTLQQSGRTQEIALQVKYRGVLRPKLGMEESPGPAREEDQQDPGRGQQGRAERIVSGPTQS